MSVPNTDNRTPERRARDEAIAAEPTLAPPDLPPGTVPMPLEAHLRKPGAGVVENGLVRPLDPNVHLPERARVIIVAEGV